MTTFLVICLLIQPWLFYPAKEVASQFRIPQGVFLDFMFLGIIFFGLKNGLVNIYRNRYFAILVGYLLMSLFMYLFLPIAMFRPAPIYMFVPFMHISLGVFALYIMLCNFDTEDYIRIAKAFCLSSMFISVFGILQYFGFDPLKSDFPGLYQSIPNYNCENVVSACLDNPNLVGMYLALTLPLFLFLRRKYLIGYALAIITIFLSKSHFAIFCALISGILSLLIHFKNIKKATFIVAIASVAAFVTMYFTGFLYHFLKIGSQLSHRVDCWQASLKIIKANPLFGSGLGFYSTLQVVTQGTWGRVRWFEVHNDYLQYAIEIGLIGVFLLALFVVNSIRHFSFKESVGNAFFVSFITFLIFMVGSFPFEVPTIAMLGLVSFMAVEKL